MTEQDLFARLLQRAWNETDFMVIDEVMAPDCVAHYGREAMPEGNLETRVTTWRRAFPDLHFEVDDHIAAGDKSVTRWHGEGTHRGEFSGIPPTGQRIYYWGVTICRLEGGKIREVWVSSNSAELLAALRAAAS